jgi:HSF-type DNA-binding
VANFCKLLNGRHADGGLFFDFLRYHVNTIIIRSSDGAMTKRPLIGNEEVDSPSSIPLSPKIAKHAIVRSVRNQPMIGSRSGTGDDENNFSIQHSANVVTDDVSSKNTKSDSHPALRPHPFFYYVDYSTMKDDNPLLPLTDLGKVPNFPAKMHAILSRKDLVDIISWMPHGRSWRVHKPREFEARVIPAYFEHVKFSSFVRQANGWGFSRITADSRDRNSYYHPKFLRGLPHLCKSVKRPGISKQVTISSEHEPDLYEISKIHPVPEAVADETAMVPTSNGFGIPCFITMKAPRGSSTVGIDGTRNEQDCHHHTYESSDASLSPHSQENQAEPQHLASSSPIRKSHRTSFPIIPDIPIQHMQDPRFAATAANLSSLAAAHQRAFGLPVNQKLYDQYNYFLSLAQLAPPQHNSHHHTASQYHHHDTTDW